MYDFSKLLTARVLREVTHRIWSESRNSREKKKRKTKTKTKKPRQQHRTRAAVEAEEDGGSCCLCTGAVKRAVTRSEEDLRVSDGRKNPVGNHFFSSGHLEVKWHPWTGLVASVMDGALQGFNRPILPPSTSLIPLCPDAERLYFRIIFNKLGGLKWLQSAEKELRGERARRGLAEMFVLEEGTECTLYIASGCDSFPSAVPLTPALWHISPGREFKGWWHSALLLSSTKGREITQFSVLQVRSVTLWPIPLI